MEEIIKLYIKKEGAVRIGGLGRLSLEYRSSELHPVVHKFTVPGKYVIFKGEENTKTDASFLIFVAGECQVTLSEAENKVNEFVERVKCETANGNAYEVSTIGKFIHNGIGKLDFEGKIDTDLSPDSFGLEDFEIPNIHLNKGKNISARIEKAATIALSQPAEQTTKADTPKDISANKEKSISTEKENSANVENVENNVQDTSASEEKSINTEKENTASVENVENNVQEMSANKEKSINTEKENTASVENVENNVQDISASEEKSISTEKENSANVENVENNVQDTSASEEKSINTEKENTASVEEKEPEPAEEDNTTKDSEAADAVEDSLVSSSRNVKHHSFIRVLLIILLFILLSLVVIMVVFYIAAPHKIAKMRDFVETKFNIELFKDEDSIPKNPNTNVIITNEEKTTIFYDETLLDSTDMEPAEATEEEPMAEETPASMSVEQSTQEQVPASVEPSVVEQSGYYIVMGSFSSEENAEKFVAEKSAEYPAVKNIGQGKSSKLYLVGLGPYSESEAKQLLANKSVKGWILKK